MTGDEATPLAPDPYLTPPPGPHADTNEKTRRCVSVCFPVQTTNLLTAIDTAVITNLFEICTRQGEISYKNHNWLSF